MYDNGKMLCNLTKTRKPTACKLSDWLLIVLEYQDSNLE